MSATDELLANNARYASGFTKGYLAAPPNRKVAVLACMDARLERADQGVRGLVEVGGGVAVG